MRLVLSLFALSLALAPVSASAHGEAAKDGAKKECHQHDKHVPHCH